MAGFVHIFRLGAEQQQHGRAVPQYQLNYNVGGNTYVRVFDEHGLSEFLHSDIGLLATAADGALEELHRAGTATITDVKIKDFEAPALGLEQLPSDY
jgi:hypothetical protein